MPQYHEFGPLKGGGTRGFKGKPGIMGGGGFTPDPFPKRPPPPPPPPFNPPVGKGGFPKGGGAGAAVIGAAALGVAVGGAIYEAAGDINSPVFDALDKFDRWRRGHPRGKPGSPKGGGEIQDSIPGIGQAGKVAGATYRIFARYNQIFPWGTVVLGEGGGNAIGPIGSPYETSPGQPGNSLSVSTGTGYLFPLGSNIYHAVRFSLLSFTVERRDGTPSSADRNQDPNKPPDSPEIREPSGTEPVWDFAPPPQGQPKRPDGRPDLDGLNGTGDDRGGYRGGVNEKPPGTKKPTPAPPDTKPGSKPGAIPSPSPFPGSSPSPSPSPGSNPSPNPSPSPGSNPSPNPQPQNPTPNRPNPNPRGPNPQPQNPTPSQPQNPTPNPNPDPTPRPYQPSDPTPKPPSPDTRPGIRGNKIYDRDGSVLWKDGMDENAVVIR